MPVFYGILAGFAIIFLGSAIVFSIVALSQYMKYLIKVVRSAPDQVWFTVQKDFNEFRIDLKTVLAIEKINVLLATGFIYLLVGFGLVIMSISEGFDLLVTAVMLGGSVLGPILVYLNGYFNYRSIGIRFQDLKKYTQTIDDQFEQLMERILGIKVKTAEERIKLSSIQREVGQIKQANEELLSEARLLGMIFIDFVSINPRKNIQRLRITVDELKGLSRFIERINNELEREFPSSSSPISFPQGQESTVSAKIIRVLGRAYAMMREVVPGLKFVAGVLFVLLDQSHKPSALFNPHNQTGPPQNSASPAKSVVRKADSVQRGTQYSELSSQDEQSSSPMSPRSTNDRRAKENNSKTG